MRLAHGVLQSVPGVVSLPQVGPTRRDAVQVPSVVQQVQSRPMHGASGSYLYHVVMHIQVLGAVQRRPTWCICPTLWFSGLGGLYWFSLQQRV